MCYVKVFSTYFIHNTYDNIQQINSAKKKRKKKCPVSLCKYLHEHKKILRLSENLIYLFIFNT